MKIKLPYDSSISLVDIWQTETKVICVKIAVLPVAGAWTQVKCLSMKKEINKMDHLQHLV